MRAALGVGAGHVVVQRGMQHQMARAGALVVERDRDSVAPDTREDVEPPPGQFACRGRADAGRRTGYYRDLLDFR